MKYPVLLTLCFYLSSSIANKDTNISSNLYSQHESESFHNGLIFYADFDGTHNAVFSGGNNKITNPSPGFTYVEGKIGKGLLVSTEKKSPVPIYETKNNLIRDKGTISFWYKPDKSLSKQSLHTNESRYLVASQSRDWRFYITCNKELISFDYYLKAPFKEINSNSWHQITLSWDNNNIKIYIDGRPISNNNVDSAWKQLWDLGPDFTIGGHQNYQRCPGVYDEFIIWDRVLNKKEITQLYSLNNTGIALSKFIGKQIIKNNDNTTKAKINLSNLVENGSFEAGISHTLLLDSPIPTSPAHPSYISPKSSPGTVNVVDTDAYHGKKSLMIKIDPDTRTNDKTYNIPRKGTATIQTLAYKLNPGTQYTLSARLKTTSPTAVLATLRFEAMRPLENPGKQYSKTINIAGDSHNWTLIKIEDLPYEAHDDLYRLRLDFKNMGSIQATLLIDAIQIYPSNNKKEMDGYNYDHNITATIQTDKLANIYDNDAPLELNIKLANQGNQQSHDTFSLSVHNIWNNVILKKELTIDLAGSEIVSKKINLGMLNTGIYRATISRNDTLETIDEISFSNLPRLPNNDFLGTHFNYDDYSMNVAKRLGIEWNRLWDNGRPTEWSKVQPESENEFNWNYSDMAINKLHREGFELLGLISWPQSKWAINWTKHSRPHWLHSKWGHDDKAELPVELFYDGTFRKQWLNYVKQVVSRYKTKITYWELLNEPYLHASPEWVADIYEATVPVIKSANPDAVIIGPCIHYRPDWVRQLLKLNILKYIDIFSYHGYSLNANELRIINEWSKFDNKERLVFDTENSALSSSQFLCKSCLGNNFSGYTSPEESAKRITKSLVSALGEGASTYFYYWMVHYDAYEKHGSFFDHAGNLRSSAVAFALTGWRLHDLNIKDKYLSNSNQTIYTFHNTNDTRAVAVIWSLRNHKLSKFNLNKNTKLYDIMGEEIQIDRYYTNILESGTPVFIETGSIKKLKDELSTLVSILSIE